MNPQRQQVIAEARTWLGTSYHHHARVKGAGVDCAMLLVEVFRAIGLLPADYQPPFYSIQWHLHHSRELYLEMIESLGGRQVTEPAPADLAVWRFGRAFSHAAIVVAWPRILHAAAAPLRVCLEENALTSMLGLGSRPVRFYSAWEQL